MNNTTISQSPLDDLQSKMHCFALPFGALGFVVHFLGIIAIWYFINNESPLPTITIERFQQNLWMGCMGICGGIGVSIYNAIRCRDEWPLVLLSIWKGIVIASVNATSIELNIEFIRRRRPYSRSNEPDVGASLVPYYFAPLVGIAGLGAIAWEGWEDPRMKTACSVAVVAYILVMAAIGTVIIMGRDAKGFWHEVGVWIFGLWLGVALLGVMVSDWILAAAAGNMDGVPRGRDIVFVCTYALYLAAALIPLMNV
ncbi:hypothetical protein BCR34DRAFT_44867 [Clohesyomyces aquaticus]|uniref:Uncharacterized protein n=1 Tax=Clohesyomyces aquaticus TaxID=1231657 RepID=A0A1Y1Z5T6_9PLEO|nr:hypothetical protein BCR34DRAFT_44867 [Clohesyomyces aquaticus]